MRSPRFCIGAFEGPHGDPESHGIYWASQAVLEVRWPLPPQWVPKPVPQDVPEAAEIGPRNVSNIFGWFMNPKHAPEGPRGSLALPLAVMAETNFGTCLTFAGC